VRGTAGTERAVFGWDASRLVCFCFVAVFGESRGAGGDAGGDVPAAEDSSGSLTGSSARGMTNPKSTSPTLCRLESGQREAVQNKVRKQAWWRTLPRACGLACAPVLE
jgi:hypothetical protein